MQEGGLNFIQNAFDMNRAHAFDIDRAPLQLAPFLKQTKDAKQILFAHVYRIKLFSFCRKCYDYQGFNGSVSIGRCLLTYV
jgi:hypothetical protein